MVVRIWLDNGFGCRCCLVLVFCCWDVGWLVMVVLWLLGCLVLIGSVWCVLVWLGVWLVCSWWVCCVGCNGRLGCCVGGVCVGWLCF